VEPPIEDETSRHPPAYRLDAIAAGDEDEGVSTHLASCEACTRYVFDLRERVALFRGAQETQMFLARLRARRERRASRPRWSRAAWVAVPTFAAAMVLVVVRTRPPDQSSLRTAQPGSDLGSQFKGELAVAVIRERAGHQERLVGPFQVHADDRIRIEVSTDRVGSLSGGLLADDGEWTPLLAPGEFEAGTHYSKLAARFDATPTRATLLVGKPDDVDRARRTRDFIGVVAWRVTSEPAP
jgi:hypothetical protein